MDQIIVFHVKAVACRQKPIFSYSTPTQQFPLVHFTKRPESPATSVTSVKVLLSEDT